MYKLYIVTECACKEYVEKTYQTMEELDKDVAFIKLLSNIYYDIDQGCTLFMTDSEDETGTVWVVDLYDGEKTEFFDVYGESDWHGDQLAFITEVIYCGSQVAEIAEADAKLINSL